jgi:hypothetical protein
MARRKKSTAKRSVSQAQRRATGTITTVRARVVGSVRDYVKAVESLLDWLEHEIDRATSAARDQLERLLHEAGRQIEVLEERGKEARKRLTAPYRKQAARLVARLEEGIADVAPGLRAPRANPSRKKRSRKKRATKKKA